MGRRSRLGIYSGLYAIFYSFCLYKNLGGATFPFFVIGTLCYISLCTKEFGYTWKKDTALLAVLTVLIGLSHPLTDKSFIHAFNIIFSFILLFYIAMHQFSYDKDWSFSKTLYNLLCMGIGAFSKFFTPFTDLSEYLKSKKQADPEKEGGPNRFLAVTLTVIIMIPVLIIVTAILASADYVFARMMGDISNALFKEATWLKVSLLSIFVFFFVYGLFVFLSKLPFTPGNSERKTFDPTVAVTAGALLDIVYLVFSVIQIVYLFIGKMQLPLGMTYAKYAREGFYQLLAICFFNLILVLIGKSLFSDNIILKIILTVMCACTYIMTASSVLRLILYIRYYYFTFVRVLALWALFVICVLLTGLLIHIWTDKINLFKFSFVFVIAAYVVLAFSHTDYWIARFNVSQMGVSSGFFLDSDGYDDMRYFQRHCCLDAADVILSLDDSETTEKFLDNNKANKPLNFRNFNVSRYLAVKKAGPAIH